MEFKEKIERSILLNSIERDMCMNSIKYVDPWSVLRPIYNTTDDDLYSYTDIYNYFCFSEKDDERKRDLTKKYPLTKCGLWLLDIPNAEEFIADTYGDIAPDYESDEADIFWEKIYEKIKDWPEEEFMKRNKNYLKRKRR